MNNWKQYTSKEINVGGWLKKQLEIQAAGLSGNLHKVWPDVRDSAWIGGNREGWERVPYWLDGFIPLAYLLRDDELVSAGKKYIDAIISRQEDDGWICPCSKEKRASYDSWALQLISKTLLTYYDCSGDERIPDVIYRALKNYYELLKSGEIHLFHWGKFRWFETFIALNFLNERYNEEWIKELAFILKEQGYDYNEAIPLWESPTRIWRYKTHIVNLAMMLKAEAVSFGLLGQEYTDEAEKFRTILDKYNGTVYDSFTGDECLSGISPVQGTELCAIAEQMYSYELLFAYTGDNKWLQRLEVLAFNAFPATVSEDMWSHQYVQLSNQIACQKFFMKTPFGTNGPRAHLFGLEPNYGCCTANFSQAFPKLALSAFMHKEGKIISALMLPCILKDENVSIEVITDYPFENRCRYVISAKESFDFIVRIPDFAKNLKVNGRLSDTEDLNFRIESGDTEIDLEFESETILRKRPNDLYAVQNGSLLFSLPVSYKRKQIEYTRRGVERKYPYCDYELKPISDWSYAFSADNFSVTRHKLSNIPFSETDPPVTVKAKMRKIKWGYRFLYKTMCAKTPKSLIPVSEEKEIELIPYACAKLRMTEMPLVK